MNAFPGGAWEREKPYQARFLGLVCTPEFPKGEASAKG